MHTNDLLKQYNLRLSEVGFYNHCKHNSKANNLETNTKQLNNHRFYTFTDGLSESFDEKGEEIGIEGSIKIIENNYNKDLNEQLLNVTKEVIRTAGDNKLSDDLTLLSIGK